MTIEQTKFKTARERVDEQTDIRRAILANGWTPLANKGKACRLEGWPTLTVTDAMIDDWSGSLAYQTTGVRIEGDIVAIDVDIDNKCVVADLLNWCIDTLGEEFERGVLIRTGSGAKECWLVRCDGPVQPTTGAKFLGPDGKDHKVELFSAGSPRQIGAYGIHTAGREITNPPLVEYGWEDDRGPHNVPVDALPALTKAQIHAITLKAFELMTEAGWEKNQQFDPAEHEGDTRYDISEVVYREHVAPFKAGHRMNMGPITGEKTDTDNRGKVHQFDEFKGVYDFKTCRLHLPVWAEPKALDDLHAQLSAKLRGLIGVDAFEEIAAAAEARIAADRQKRGERQARREKPVIEIKQTELSDTVDAVLAAVADEPDWYKFGTTPATVDDRGVIRVFENKPTAQYMLGRAMRFEAYKKKGDDFELVPAKPGDDLIHMLVAEGRRVENLRLLDGVSPVPVLRRDGTVQTAPGYDADTRMIYLPAGEPVAVIEAPSLDDANAALDEIETAFKEFRMESAADYGALLALVLTAAVRPSLPLAPGFMIDAPVVGSGKTTLAMMAAAVAGHAAPSRVLTKASVATEEETMRALKGEVLVNNPSVIFDNIKGQVKSNVLASALTSGELAGKMLYSDTNVVLPIRLLLMMTSTQCSLNEDLSRRFIVPRINREVENPALSGESFSLADPVGFAVERRARIVSACLTLIRAKQVHASPDDDMPPLGSYGDWDRLIRQTVLWIGREFDEIYGDPVATVARSMEDFAEIDGGKVLFEYLWRMTRGKPFTASDVARWMRERGRELPPGVTHEMRTNVIEDFTEKKGGDITARRVGYYLRDHRQRTYDGRRLEPVGMAKGKTRFAMKPVK